MNFKIEDFKFYHSLEIRWNDLDALGHVNNVLYIDYFQTGRGKYMTKVSKTWNWNKHMFVIANINCNYIREIGLKVKNPRIGVRISKMGTKSFEIDYVILSEEKDHSPIIHAYGSSVQVMIDLESKKSIEIPDWLKLEVKTFEQLD
jgi:acyl-CoA thioester hydrolase